MSGDILLGIVIGAHGLKGEVRVKTFTETAEGLGAHGPLHTKDGRHFAVQAIRAAKRGEAIARFSGVEDRNAAEMLKGAELWIPRAALPAAAPEEFYHADLVGRRAEDEEGRVIGQVAALHNFGAGAVIEILRDDGDNVFLPFTRAVVPVIETGRIVIAQPDEVDAGTEFATRKGWVE